jgi:hypothetical protein
MDGQHRFSFSFALCEYLSYLIVSQLKEFVSSNSRCIQRINEKKGLTSRLRKGNLKKALPHRQIILFQPVGLHTAPFVHLPSRTRSHRKARYLRKVRSRSQIQDMYIIKRSVPVESTEQEQATVGQNGFVISARRWQPSEEEAGPCLVLQSHWRRMIRKGSQ